MNVYYYCSYTGSPVGYIMGSLAYDAGRTENYQLQRENIPPLIRKCFELGTVRNAFGSLPAGSGYFLLVKKLTARGGAEKEASEYYLNLALVTKDEDEYRGWFKEGGGDARGIAAAIKDTLELDRGSEFGFTVRPQALKALRHTSFRPLFQKSGAVGKPGLYLELTVQTDCKALAGQLGLSEQAGTLIPMQSTEKWVRFGKKKQSSRGPRSIQIFGLLILLLAVLGGGTALLFPKQWAEIMKVFQTFLTKP